MDWSFIYSAILRIFGFISPILSISLSILVLGGVFYFYSIISNSVKKKRDLRSKNLTVDREIESTFPMRLLKPWNGLVPISLQKYHEEASQHKLEWYQMLELDEISIQYNVDIKSIQAAIRESEICFCEPERVLSKQSEPKN